MAIPCLQASAATRLLKLRAVTRALPGVTPLPSVHGLNPKRQTLDRGHASHTLNTMRQTLSRAPTAQGTR